MNRTKIDWPGLNYTKHDNIYFKNNIRKYL